MTTEILSLGKGTAVAMVIEGSPMTCSEAQDEGSAQPDKTRLTTMW